MRRRAEARERQATICPLLRRAVIPRRAPSTSAATDSSLLPRMLASEEGIPIPRGSTCRKEDVQTNRKTPEKHDRCDPDHRMQSDPLSIRSLWRLDNERNVERPTKRSPNADRSAYGPQGRSRPARSQEPEGAPSPRCQGPPGWPLLCRYLPVRGMHASTTNCFWMRRSTE
jgi:hypothetical protein